MPTSLPAFAAVVLMGATATMPARAASGYDVGDLWWASAEPGWGVQFVQGRDTVFATLYVYDAGRAPAWFSGTLAFEGLTPQTHQPNYAGDLYRTTGHSYAAPAFDTTTVERRKVGTMQFRATALSSGTLTYTVDGVVVTRSIERQTLRIDDYEGDYAVSMSVATSKCDNPANDGTRVSQGTMSIAQATGAMTFTVAVDGGTCTYAGAFTQEGRLGNVFSNFACSSGQAGTLVFEEMNVQRFAVVGRLFGADNRGCRIDGQFAAARL